MKQNMFSGYYYLYFPIGDSQCTLILFKSPMEENPLDFVEPRGDEEQPAVYALSLRAVQ